ncbi:MAG: hypothetical protein U0441_21630 [Polyangiaceae bacterium]
MRRAWLVLMVLASAVLGLVPAACGGGAGSSSGGGGSGTSTAGSAGDGAGFIGGSGGQSEVLTITPESAEIVVTNGVGNTVDFDLLSNGTSVNAKWTIDKGSVVTIDADGIVTAVGDKGGEVQVTAQYGSQSRTAILTVKIVNETNPGGVPDGDIGVLKGPTDPNEGVVWLYPYDKTVFPKGIYPPQLMWDGAQAGDEYYIRYQTKYVDIGILTKVDPPSRFLLDEATWRTVTESGKGEDVHLTIARLVPGQPKATLAVDNTWKIASGSLRGFVYYWSNSLGRVLRIDPGKGSAPEDFLAAAGVNQNCSTCHTVSADGLTLVIGGDVPTSTFNLLTNTPSLQLGNIGKAVRNWAMPAVSPDGKVLIENNAPLPGPPGGSDGMWNPQTGEHLIGTGLDGVFLDMPAFAPSGTSIAAVDHNTHGLIKYAFDPATNMATAPTNLIDPGADGSLNAICFPSVAPAADGTWVTYHRGVYPSSLDTRNGPGDLYLANMDTPGTEIRLRAANGDDYPYPVGDRDRHYNYEPTFAPQEAGGYHWVVFTSRRTYGNLLTGGKEAVKQLWIAAIDLNPKAGEDPSHPAFWIPGQDANLNMRGFWAQKNCIVAGQACMNDSDCCGGVCQNGMCLGQPGECSDEGGSCTIDADCCNYPSDTCINGTCGTDIPQ